MRKIAGRSLVALGVAGCLLPVVPGIPFLIAGAALLGPEDPLVRRFLGWAKRRSAKPGAQDQSLTESGKPASRVRRKSS